MRTSKQVYAQVLWDDRLDPSRFRLSIDVHGPAPLRQAFVDFDPDGDIPWHRVLDFRCDEQICWDRAGTDRLQELALTGLFAPRRLAAPFWEARIPVRHDGQVWSPAVGLPEERKRLTLLTWNVLWDRFQPELLRSEERWPRLIEEVLASGADLVALQEVTPRFHRLLLRHPEVQARWWLSHGPDHADIGAADLLLMGRSSVTELGLCKLRPHKAALGAVLGCGPLVITTHLSSDHSKNAKVRREEELQRIQHASDVGLGVIWLGDFNLSSEEPILDTRDAWTLIAPGEPTFDPVANPLAVHSSRTGEPVRIDRVLLRGPYQPVSVERLGCEATDGVHPSDHFGVLAELALDAPVMAWLGVPSRRTALAWLPRDPTYVDVVRAERDPAFAHWPAHLNLLWPFVPEADFDGIVPLLEELCIPPFPATLSATGRSSGRYPTAFLKPAQPSPWKRLLTLLRSRFPTCGVPEELHLTVAHDHRPLPVLSVAEEVRELCLLSQRADGGFEVRAHWNLFGEVRFATVPEPLQAADPWGPVPEQAVLVGSRRLGVALLGADVDLLWNGTLEEAELHFGPDCRRVERAGLPGVVVHGATRIDVVVLDPDAVDDEAHQHARAAVTDADTLLEQVVGRLPLFREVLHHVKGWAKAKALNHPALGGVEGLAWGVLVAETLGDGGVRDELQRFFAHWATWDWDEGVGVEPLHPVSIGTPSAPRRVISTRARRGPLERALGEAWDLLDGGAPLELLQTPIPWHRIYAEAVWVQASSHDDEGWAMGRARALITLLGDVGPRRTPGGFALGLPRDCDPVRVDVVVAGWATLPGLDARRGWSWEVP